MSAERAAYCDAAGEEVFLHRSLLGLTQAQLAQQIGVARRSVSRWESGRCLPSIVHLDKLRKMAARKRRALIHGIAA